MNQKGNWFFKGLMVIIICGIWFLGGVGNLIGNLFMTSIRANNETGMLAWILGNFNLVFIILLILFMAGWTVLTE